MEMDLRLEAAALSEMAENIADDPEFRVPEVDWDGTARDVLVPVTLTQSGAVTTATGTLPLKRLAFKIGENEWADTSMVADDVQVKFKLALSGVGKL